MNQEKLNCWEALECGREPAEGLGSEYAHLFKGTHSGIPINEPG